MQRTKVKFSDSPCQNILRLCNVLVQVRFKAKKTNLDIQYSKLGMRDTSRVAEQLKTRSSEIKSYQENSKFVCRDSLVIGVPSRNKSLAIVVKKKTTLKKVSNFSCPAKFSWISLICSKFFVRDFIFLKFVIIKHLKYIQIFP